MIKKTIIKTVLFFLITTTQFTKANDVGSMAGISEAAGNSAQAAADQLASDAGKVTENISEATAALGEANSDLGKALDTSIAQAETAMAFAQESLAKGDITSAVQAMSLVEGVADMALGAVPDPTALDISEVDFSKEFTSDEVAALSSIAGQMGAGKVIAIQKIAGQMNAVEDAGFDAKGMMGQLDANGIGIGTAMEGLAEAGMVDMKAVMGAETFNIETFDAGSFASMNVAEMGMDPAMMAGALKALPVGAATAALETVASDPNSMGDMGETMTGAIAATMSAKGMGEDMMKSMETSIGIQNMSDMAEGMKGIEGMQEIGKAMVDMGMEDMSKTLSAAFTSPETGIGAAMSGTVGMISGAISGQASSEKNAVEQGAEIESSLTTKISEEGPTAIEMPEDVSESGMLMGAMIMAKPTLAGGLPGAMAPPEGLTAESMMSEDAQKGMSEMMGDMSSNEIGEAMAGMTGIEAGAIDELGMIQIASETGLTPGLVASMGAAGISGMDISAVMASNVAGLGSKAVQELTGMAADGNMSAGVMGDMMEVGLVNQGTMVAMGEKGMENLTDAMGMEGGNMELAAMTGGMMGMGTIDMNTTIDPQMAESMGLIGGEEGVKLGDIMPTGGPVSIEDNIVMENETVGMDTIAYEARMNIGQVSAAMGIGIAADEALAPAMQLTGDEAALAEAAMGSAISAQGAAAAAMGSSAMSAATGIGGMGEGTMGTAMGSAMQEGMSGAMGSTMAGAMAGAGQEGYGSMNTGITGEGSMNSMGSATAESSAVSGAMSGAMEGVGSAMGGLEKGMSEAVSEAANSVGSAVSEASGNEAQAGAGQEGYGSQGQGVGAGQEGYGN